MASNRAKHRIIVIAIISLLGVGRNAHARGGSGALCGCVAVC